MNNGINWLGNRVVDADTPYHLSRAPLDDYSNSDNLSSIPMRSQRQPQTQPTQTQPPMQSQPPAQPTQRPPVVVKQPIIMERPITEPPIITQAGPPPSTEVGYIPYYLTLNIGKYVRAEFIIGNDQYVDKTGRIYEVGINYFVLEDINSRSFVMCDLYSVKFVTILPSNETPPSF